MWSFEFANAAAVAEIEALPADLRSKLLRVADLIRAGGPAALPATYAKHLQDKLWEIRLSSKTGIARSLYVTLAGQRVVVLRTFLKKTQKTPPREIALALARAREVR